MPKYSFLGDLHLGNGASDIEAFRYALKKSNKVILMGDMIEAITKKDPRHADDNILTYSEQITQLIKIIKPYKKKIVTYIIGNHESTLLSRTDIDSVDLICKHLDIKPAYTETLIFDEIKCFVTHGTSTGITYGGAVTKLLNYAKDHRANYYFMGHTHKLFDLMIQHEPFPYTIVNTGTFLGQPIYAQKMGYPAPIKGYYVLDTYKNELKKMVI